MFAENKEIQKLAEQFVLINLVVSVLFTITDISPVLIIWKEWFIFPIHFNHTAWTGICSKYLIWKTREENNALLIIYI